MPKIIQRSDANTSFFSSFKNKIQSLQSVLKIALNTHLNEIQIQQIQNIQIKIKVNIIWHLISHRTERK
jgi:hypothetical protein